MPVSLRDAAGVPRLVLEGVVPPEEVDQLVALLREHPEAVADLSACEHLHTAALQALLVSGAAVAGLPEGSFWAHFFKHGKGRAG
jgi:hypothetical protein